jgi:glucan 1,3-beta-glucosidase
MIRSITGYGAGNGPIIAMHEGFEGIAAWNGFLSGADRLALDQHPYLAFQATQNNNTWVLAPSSTEADFVRLNRRAVGAVGRMTRR